MIEIRPAATVIIGRERAGMLEVLLVQRNRKLAFAPGLWVFPGGKIDASELAASKEELEAARLAAVRETQEETGLEISVASLQFVHHWTTPVTQPRRFGTYFFFAALSEHQDVVIDDGEIKASQWVNPAEAVAQFRAAALPMLPPTLLSLMDLEACANLDEAVGRAVQRTPRYILPVLRPYEDRLVCLYEGDAGYETGEPTKVGARHRLIVNFSGGDFEFVYRDCEELAVVEQ